jgi:hypothetical protein
MKPSTSVSALLNSIDQTYEQVKSALDTKLNSRGYQIIEEKCHAESFGSRYAVWSNTRDAVRLLWDGKDEWFYLQSLDTMPFDWRDDWEDLIYIPFDPRKHDLSYASEIPNKIVGSLG